MDEIAKIDVEIEACEHAISHALWVVEAEDLRSRVKELQRRRRLLEQTG
tara:strand:+ start:401 stop:547 length:147 start_codon:yes stop_codon:yes gene_type:complete